MQKYSALNSSKSRPVADTPLLCIFLIVFVCFSYFFFILMENDVEAWNTWSEQANGMPSTRSPVEIHNTRLKHNFSTQKFQNYITVCVEGGIFTSLLHSTISFFKSSYSKREKKFIPVSLSLWYLSNTDEQNSFTFIFYFLWLVDLNRRNLFIVAIMRQVSKNTVLTKGRRD